MKNNKKLLQLLLFLIVLPTWLIAQTTYKDSTINIELHRVTNPTEIRPSFSPQIISLESPIPSGNSKKKYLLEQKKLQSKKFPRKQNLSKEKAEESLAEPMKGKEVGVRFYRPNGTFFNLQGGRPNDNTVAISKDNIVLMSYNSEVYAYDLNKDTTVFERQRIALEGMESSTPLPSGHYFDPKVIYDEIQDRFILMFLKDNEPATNKIIICFSTTNNPNDEWNVYQLPGDVLNSNRWTDFPAIAITEEDLFLTGNLIVPDVSWQIGFDGSIIWQINKQTGYNGDVLLSKTFSDIKFNGKFIRNLHPVQGAKGIAEECYLLSNRNFDLTNDSIFVLKINGKLSAAPTTLDVNVYKTDVPYGVPPNGLQEDTDDNPENGLQTNDARILGAIKINDEIQFVNTTIDPSTGNAAIYHGTIKNINDVVITGHIINDPIKDFGYPNIAWSGNEDCEYESIIAFNHTSRTDFAGFSAIYHKDGAYSDVIPLKEGENYVDRLNGSYERWGDYFGMQRQYNSNKIYALGFYGLQNNSNGSWLVELESPDTTKLQIIATTTKSAALCEQEINLNVMGGNPPYQYRWNKNPNNTSNLYTNICANDTIEVTVTDNAGCSKTQTFNPTLVNTNNIYPNPFTENIAIQFFSKKDAATVTAKIYDIKGTLVVSLISKKVNKGLNELGFRLSPLPSGTYILSIRDEEEELLKEKIIKQ